MPFNVFCNSLKIGNIYKFLYPPVHPTIRHYFVLLGVSNINNEVNYIFGCCTSQFEKKKKYLEYNGLPNSTLVPIPPSNTNGLTHPDNCINCNDPKVISKTTFEEIFNTAYRVIPFIGNFSDGDIDQLFRGVHVSDLVEEWIKDVVPKSLDDIPPDLLIF